MPAGSTLISALISLVALSDAPVAGARPTPAEAIAVVAPAAKIAADRVALRERSEHSGQWLAVVPVPDDEGHVDSHLTVHVALLTLAQGQWQVVSRARLERETLSMDFPTYALDTAPFRLNADEVAFGVRERTRYASEAHAEAGEQLIVLRVAGQALVPILEITSFASGGGEAGAAQESDSRAVIAVGERQSSGFFDWLVTTTTTEGTKRKKHKKVARYTWTGKEYVAAPTASRPAGARGN